MNRKSIKRLMFQVTCFRLHELGKKRIKEESSEEGKSAGSEAAVKKSQETKSKGGVNAVKRAVVYIQATYNNTIISITDEKGNVLAWSSAGAVGFKGTKKSTPYAAARVAEILADKVSKISIPEVVVLVKGVGSGRESAIRAFANRGFNISLIKDVTPIPHNGPRSRKVRRV